MADIFLSYASEDRDRIEPLVEHLASHGWSVWWDRELVAGQSFDEKIEQALDTARCVVVVWSENAVTSRWCRAEATEGLERGILVPASIDGARPPLAFRTSQTASLEGWPELCDESEMAMFISGIRDVLGTEAIEIQTTDTLSSESPGRLNRAWRSGASNHASGSRPLVDRPLIAVLPFENMSDDVDQEYFTDGVTDDIITGLSKSRMFFVIPRNSTFTYKGTDVDVRRVAEDLDVQYVVEGSVRRAGNNIRITAQLIDAFTHRHVWAERYEGLLDDVFTLQDEITTKIVATIAPEYMSAEKHRVEHDTDRNLEAWDHYIHAYWHFSRFTREDFDAAIDECGKAINADPRGAGHYALLAIAHCMRAFYGWGNSRPDDMKDARGYAEKAVVLNDRDARAQRALGLIEMYSRRTEQAVHHFEKAIALDPFEAENYALLGNAHSLAGDYDTALSHVERAISMSPRDAFIATWHSNLAMSAAAIGRNEEAEGWAHKAVRENPQFPGGYRSLIVALAHLGRMEEAIAVLLELKTLLPHLDLAQLSESIPLTNQTHLSHYLDGLQLAGLE
jgi:TolB-like protein/Flp pilus assembly protein TadD